MEIVRVCSILYPFQRAIVVHAKKARYAMLNPAPSVQSRTDCGRIRLRISHAMVIVTGLTAAIQTGKAVLPDATSMENKIDAIRMRRMTGAYVMINTLRWREIMSAITNCEPSSTLFNA